MEREQPTSKKLALLMRRRNDGRADENSKTAYEHSSSTTPTISDLASKNRTSDLANRINGEEKTKVKS